MSLYGIPAPAMESAGVRVHGRTAVECCVDRHAMTVGRAVYGLQLPPQPLPPLVLDLFCGSGNLGYWISRCLGVPAYAAELDTDVHDATRHNLRLVGADVRLRRADYRELLGSLSPRGPWDVCVLDPPPPEDPAGRAVDAEAPGPSLAQVLDDIRSARADRPCVVVVRTTDAMADDSPQERFASARHLCAVAPEPASPPGFNTAFHLYAVPG
ncbi:class I SAM-dependent methyltransferase [Streptomyces flavidovirens]|uniref:class I SAM-dependent methyltransferase n=1 Tax=Streptomyces flavidovirens TaxID=67298 RepID=UPI0034234DFA